MQRIKDDDDMDGILSIISYAVISFADKIICKRNAVANQIIYLYYRQPRSLPKKLRNYIDDMIEDGRLLVDEDYHGFAGGTFAPDEESKGMLKEFNTSPDFYSQCVVVYQQQQALSLLNLSQSSKPDFVAKHKELAKFIRDFESVHGNDAWTSVPTKLLIDVYTGIVPMDYLRLVASVKSVLYKKNFNLTYKSVILCRMFGAKKASILNELFNQQPQLKVKHEHLSRRRQWENFIATAEENGYFAFYSTGRRFFVSLTMTKNELRQAIENKRERKLSA
jgi:hypothetical protein